MFPRLRTVIEDHEFVRRATLIQPDVRRLDEQLDAVKWAVSRNPEVFTKVVGNVYVIETFALGEEEEYVFIFFTIDDADTCTLRWIERGREIVAETTMVPVP